MKNIDDFSLHLLKVERIPVNYFSDIWGLDHKDDRNRIVKKLKKDYVIIAQTAPDGKIVNKEHSHGDDKEAAWRHYDLLKRQGWRRIEIELREKEAE